MEEKEIDYINVIPFVDIMLVLLTIVLTTSTFIATGGIPVDLPKASQKSGEALKTRTIEIDKAGYIYFDGRAVSLRGLDNALMLLERNTPFVIRADRRIPLQSFVDVLDVVKSRGFKRVGLQTELKRR